MPSLCASPYSDPEALLVASRRSADEARCMRLLLYLLLDSERVSSFSVLTLSARRAKSRPSTAAAHCSEMLRMM